MSTVNYNGQNAETWSLLLILTQRLLPLVRQMVECRWWEPGLVLDLNRQDESWCPGESTNGHHL